MVCNHTRHHAYRVWAALPFKPGRKIQVMCWGFIAFTLWQQTAWLWSQGLGKAQPADSASKAPAPASLAGGYSLAGSFHDWGLWGLHSLLPQDPAEGLDPLAGTCLDPHPSVGKGLGLPEGAFCRCCIGETVGAGGGECVRPSAAAPLRPSHGLGEKREGCCGGR